MLLLLLPPPPRLLQVGFTTASGQLSFLRPRLVLGCDGIKSGVRQTLAAWATPTATSQPQASPHKDWDDDPDSDALPSTSRREAVASAPPSKPQRGGSTPAPFTMVQTRSGSTGLRYKVLPLPPNPSVRTVLGDCSIANPHFGEALRVCGTVCSTV